MVKYTFWGCYHFSCDDFDHVELEDMIHSRDEQLLELLRQLNEYEEAVLKLESIIHDANSKIMALDKKCDSPAKEIKRINAYKIENSVHFIPSIGSTGSTPLNVSSMNSSNDLYHLMPCHIIPIVQWSFGKSSAGGVANPK